MSTSYTGRDIQVLQGLEPVRLRPAMYIGNTSSSGLHHCFTEILDNAVDEALNGHCNKIDVIIGADNSVTVSDNGRGIPVDMHPVSGKNALETILTTLHSGGKFSQKNYQVSGGLHGVGISVVNALAEELRVTSYRDGFSFTQSFSQGNPKTKLSKAPLNGHVRGTEVYFRPDPEIFKDITFKTAVILERCRAKAFLTRGLKISVVDQINNQKEIFYYKEGIRDFINVLTAGKNCLLPEPFFLDHENDMRLELVLQWTSDTDSIVHSYANSIHTTGGGSHENGLKSGLTRAIREYISRNNLLPKGIKGMTADDVKEGLVAILSVFIKGNLEFQGQTKERLNSEVGPVVETMVRTAFENFLFHNPTSAELVVNRVLLACQARQASRLAQKTVRRQSYTKRLSLPGKLADCTSTDVNLTELFIVEGDSAGGSGKQARNRYYQAVLPMRGKILNVEQATSEKMQANKEIQDLINCLGTGMGKSFDYGRLRYGKICICTDADVDGYHISTLLLTFFYRYMPELIIRGHVFLAQPPLFQITTGSGKKQQVHYAYADQERDRFLAQDKNAVIKRYKGLGEMNVDELKETTLAPGKRRLLQVRIEDTVQTDQVFETLMGKDVSKRFLFIQENAGFVREVDV
ncbi:MAG: type IIA DNA topoisomerase subunit B [Deltaproteobacteria bacterium]|nr:type IIA DNA topoisomerase subunit B [Deltaproteobacteria bacterium]